jgi:hypothetical protein
VEQGDRARPREGDAELQYIFRGDKRALAAEVAGGISRTITRPMLNLPPLFHAYVRAFTPKVRRERSSISHLNRGSTINFL